MKWKLGNIEIKNKVVLAPMAGISNPSYIKICEEMGLGLAYTELISAEAIVRNNKKTFEMLSGIDSLSVPVGVQLFGSNIDSLVASAKILTTLYKNIFIDINMGCPVPKVALRAQAGSALLKDPSKVGALVKSVVNAVDVPVTVKIRTGWDSNSINAVEIAKVCEWAGASAVTVHGRTRAQGYSGVVDLDTIKLVKEAVNIPVIGNGDIKSCYDALYMLNYTKCDAIMIGRGLLGNPWLIKDCVDYLENNTKPITVSNDDKIDMITKHLNYLLKNKVEKISILEMRSHAAWYLKGMPNNSDIRSRIMSTSNKEEFFKVINEYKEVLHDSSTII